MILMNSYMKFAGSTAPPTSEVEGNDSYTVLLLNMDGTDASTTFTDSSIGGSTHTITANGDAQVDTAIKQFGTGSALFDGTDDYLTAPNSSDFNMQTAGDWTVDFWHRPTSLALSYCLIHFFNAIVGANSGLNIYIKTDGSFNVDDGNVASNLSAGTLVINTWYHLAVTRESGTVKLWIDGVLVDSELAQNYGDSSSTNVQIGRYKDGSLLDDANGSIDELRISKGIARWTANFTPPTGPYTQDVSDYIALYKFEDNGNDETTNHNATMSNVTYSDTGGVTGQDKYGIWNGTTSYGQVTDHADITDLKTVSCWIYLNDWGELDAGRILEKNSLKTSLIAQGGVHQNIGFYKVFDGTSGFWVSADSSITLSTWYHIAYTYAQDNNVATNPILYINGVSVAVTEDSTPVGTMTSDTGGDLYIGNNSANDRTFDGRIENIRFYDRVLTPTEILAIYDEEVS